MTLLPIPNRVMYYPIFTVPSLGVIEGLSCLIGLLGR